MSSVTTSLYIKEGEARTEIAPSTTAAVVAMPAESGADSTVEAEIIALRAKVASVLNSGASFKGSLTASNGLPTVGYKAGWQYVVQEAGTYAGQSAEVGEMFVAIRDYASGSASNKDWTFLQVNLVGAVTGPGSAVANRVAAFDGTSGKILKDSGFTIGKSVPADAEFTDTTYAAATAQADGLMTAAQFTKLAGGEAGADKTSAASVEAAGAFMTAKHSADSITQGSTNLFLTSAERSKLSGIAAGAEVNQNAFAKVVVGSTTITADSKADTLTLAAGTGITLTPDSGGDKVTIAETYVDTCVVSSLDDVPANLRNGGLIIVRSAS
ncbi:MAG: hypothetical protein IJY48_05685 [Mailhella sp.]|nr:hypothetical protein [Mailhella sp.]